MPKVKGFRLSDDILLKIEKLKELYRVRGDSQLMEMIINDIYELKQSKALVPFEELDKRNKELKQAFFELGRLKQSVDEKEKRIEELKKNVEIQKDEKENKKGFWARLFGL